MDAKQNSFAFQKEVKWSYICTSLSVTFVPCGAAAALCTGRSPEQKQQEEAALLLHYTAVRARQAHLPVVVLNYKCS